MLKTFIFQLEYERDAEAQAPTFAEFKQEKTRVAKQEEWAVDGWQKDVQACQVAAVLRPTDDPQAPARQPVDLAALAKTMRAADKIVAIGGLAHAFRVLTAEAIRQNLPEAGQVFIELSARYAAGGYSAESGIYSLGRLTGVEDLAALRRLVGAPSDTPEVSLAGMLAKRLGLC